jgi:2-alkenal reductase
MRLRLPAIIISLIVATLACNLTPRSAAVPTAAPLATVVPVQQVVPAVATTPPLPPITVSSSEEEVLINLYQRVNPAVVSIFVDGAEGSGQGSGFLYDANGHIVTNQHVINGANVIEVDFPSGLKTRARLVGEDADADLAVIKVDEIPAGVQPLPLADSDLVRVGQRAIAIGNPFGQEGTMTLGIISAVGRTLSGNRQASTGGSFTAPDILQTDAPINPGNSGGPLLNLSGEVIGVNRAISVDPAQSADVGPSNSGVGYSIAANTVKQIVPFLISDGKFIYPYLGISSTPEMTLELKELLDAPGTVGTYVTTVIPGGPADEAGLQGDSGQTNFAGDGDLIVAVDGREVKVFGDLMSYLVNKTRPGQEITLTVFRRGETQEVKLVLGERP